MKTFLAILAVATLPLTAHAQIMKCVGAGGRIEFAAACPPGTKAESTGIRNNPGAAAAAPQKSLAERDAEFRKRTVEQQEAAKKGEEKNQETADRKQNCEAAQSYLRSLQRIAAKRDEALTASREQAMEPLPDAIAAEAEAEQVES